mmetsp:Transcript_56341/g.104211  ORF Transcript_56341/g.104211 Transcript_56341/m.104211 type:complete len:237 (-) Transcript_56341:177-887(-)
MSQPCCILRTLHYHLRFTLRQAFDHNGLSLRSTAHSLQINLHLILLGLSDTQRLLLCCLRLSLQLFSHGCLNLCQSLYAVLIEDLCFCLCCFQVSLRFCFCKNCCLRQVLCLQGKCLSLGLLLEFLGFLESLVCLLSQSLHVSLLVPLLAKLSGPLPLHSKCLLYLRLAPLANACIISLCCLRLLQDGLRAFAAGFNCTSLFFNGCLLSRFLFLCLRWQGAQLCHLTLQVTLWSWE